MLSPENFVISLGRALEVVRTRPDAIAEQKAALRNLVALTKLGEAHLRLESGALRCEDTAVSTTLPGVATLVQQMDAHDVQEIRIAHHASAADLLNLLRALAVNLGGYAEGGVGERLDEAGASSVSVVTVRPDALQAFGRPVSVSEAFEAVAEGAEVAEEAGSPATPATPATRLSHALAALDDGFMGPKALDLASDVGRETAAAFADHRTAEAVAAMARLIRLEQGLPDGSPRRSVSIVLKRLLTPTALTHVADVLFLPESRGDAVTVLARGGGDATELLITRLGEADTMQERRGYFDALRGLGDAMKTVLHLLDDANWQVVRNVAELVGEAGVEEAVPQLGRLMQHDEPRVRRAAAVAMARIGTPRTADHLRRALRESDTEVRALVAGAVQGRQSSALAMPLALAAEEESDAELQREYFRALGRIGTPDAVQALIKAVQPGGRFIGRKPVAVRLAAMDGLRAAGGPVAIGTLEGLARDGDKHVRQAAQEALEALTS